MKKLIGSIVKSILPKTARYKLLRVISKPKITKAKKIFEKAPDTPQWLGWDELASLQQKYPFPLVYSYDPKSCEQRGMERAHGILDVIPTRKEKITTFLELGCGDGMASYILQRMGKVTTAIDKKEIHDERPKREGVRCLQMDAARLNFKDENFDCVFSYDSFEHFQGPESVLQEAIRVVRKGGYIYLVFDPLYMSSRGLHAQRQITVPYCQFLFTNELLADFTRANGMKPIKFYQVNGWSLEDYRSLWHRYAHRLKTIRYLEKPDVFHLDLIMKYTPCFKSKTKCFDNLIIRGIEILFKKVR